MGISDSNRPNSIIRMLNERSRVLVVDDDRAARITMSEILADEFRVFVAGDGKQARAILASERVDLICTDFQMPGINGLELLALASADDPFVAGVLVTGHKEYLARTQEKDKLDYEVLLKPFDPVELLTLVRRAIKLASLRRTLSGSERPPKVTPRP